MWKVVGASVAGASHEAMGKECEDAMGWRASDDIACLAVADGAGSRARSGQGACLAVERALLLAATSASAAASGGDAGLGGVLRRIFADVREQISALAAVQGGSEDSYATTLAVAIVTGAKVAIGQIGDTIAVTGDAGHYLAVAPEPPAGYVNETMFITEPGAPEQIRVTVLPASRVDTVVLATDGLRFKILADLATGAPFVPFFEDLEKYVRSSAATDEAMARFLATLDDQAGDDKTLVAAVRRLTRTTAPVLARSVVEELIKAAEDADMIVVGSRGAGGFAQLMLGSVSSLVVQHATCPVVIIPSAEHG